MPGQIGHRQAAHRDRTFIHRAGVSTPPGASAQFLLDPHWTLSASWDWIDGGDDARQELYSALSYRFW